VPDVADAGRRPDRGWNGPHRQARLCAAVVALEAYVAIVGDIWRIELSSVLCR